MLADRGNDGDVVLSVGRVQERVEAASPRRYLWRGAQERAAVEWDLLGCLTQNKLLTVFGQKPWTIVRRFIQISMHTDTSSLEGAMEQKIYTILLL